MSDRPLAPTDVKFAQIAGLPVWAVSCEHTSRAVAAIRGYHHPAHGGVTYKVTVPPTIAARFPELPACLDMDGFRTLDAAQNWCREVMGAL